MIEGSSFDSGGFLVAFIFTAGLVPAMGVLYRREQRGRQRPYYLFRYRWGIAGAALLALLTGLRRFVLHQ